MDSGLTRSMKTHGNYVVGMLFALALIAPGFAAEASAISAKATARCKSIQVELQSYVKIRLDLFAADDASNDELNAGDTAYLHCQYRQQDNSLIDIGLHDDSDGLFDTITKNYAVLPGFGDKARYTVRGSAGQKWLDVVRGKVACEARFGLDKDDSPLIGDWKQVGGKICTDLLAKH